MGDRHERFGHRWRKTRLPPGWRVAIIERIASNGGVQGPASTLGSHSRHKPFLGEIFLAPAGACANRPTRKMQRMWNRLDHRRRWQRQRLPLPLTLEEHAKFARAPGVME